ncbi:MAG: hypothetical protein E7452_01905 [Ruminococcaceae bacterium]|nr:hypothetical protein [Oscillospiraceae bacterium]
MRKRILASLLTLCMLLSLVPTAFATDTYGDVPPTHMFYDEITYVSENGLMNGIGNDQFDPAGTTTRAMVVTTLWRFEGEPAVDAENPFTDVPEGQWYTDAILWAADAGIIKGYGDGKMGPADEMTREQLAVTFYRYSVYKGMDVETDEDNLAKFNDADEVSSWAVEAMNWAVGVGLFNGTAADKLSPEADASRGQIAAILYRYSEKVVPAANKVTVTFDENYTDGKVTEVTVEVGETVEKPADPTRDGYDFKGWYTADGKAFDFDAAIESDVTVLAKWTRYIVIAHTHEWVAGTPVEPTCTTQGYTPYTCSCGSSKNDDFVPVYAHIAGVKCPHCGVTEVETADQLAKALTAADENIHVILLNNIDLPISSLGTITGGSGEYKLGGEETETIIIDLNEKKLNITTTYWSAIGAKNDDATITIQNGIMTSTGNSAGTWNAYDLRFSNCNYVIEKVTFEKSVALDNAGKTTTMNKVTINDTSRSDVYGLWITAEGQTVTLTECTIDTTDATDGRGIKIDEQYVDAPAKVTLTVSGTGFKTEEKAAILVKSAAGADITLSEVNISDVAADSIFEVWVDEDAAASYDLVTVTGGDKKLEGTNVVVVKTADELVAAFANLQAKDIIYIANDIDMTGKTITPVTGNKAFTMLGNGNTISNLNSTERALFVAHSGSSAYTFDGVVLENCSVVSTTNYGALFVGDGDTSDAITITNCHVKNCSVESAKYAAAFVGYTAGWNVQNDGPVYSDITIEDCSVTGGSITGGGSVGAAIGHSGGNVDTTSTITGLIVSGTAINGEDAAHTGIAVGTAHVGETIINDVSYAGVTGNYNTDTNIYGRFVPGTTGVLIIDGKEVVSSSASLNSAIKAGEAADVTLNAGDYTLAGTGNQTTETVTEVKISGTKATVITINKPAFNNTGIVEFNGVTIKGSGDYTGVQHVGTVTYNDCVIDGMMNLYGNKVVFNDCTFNLAKGQYVKVYGALEVEFNRCTFNTAGKAILLYKDGGQINNKVSVTGCTFNASAGDTAGAIVNQNCAAIEIDNYQSKITLTTSGNIIDEDFSGEWRIKTFYDNGNIVTVNGKEYTTLALDGKTMTIDEDKKVTVNE